MLDVLGVLATDEKPTNESSIERSAHAVDKYLNDPKVTNHATYYGKIAFHHLTNDRLNPQPADWPLLQEHPTQPQKGRGGRGNRGTVGTAGVEAQ